MNIEIDFSVFEPFPILHTKHLLLREFTSRDAQALFLIRGNNDTMKYMDAPIHQTVNDSKAMMADIALSYQEQTGINWVIEDRKKGCMIGYIGFWRILTHHIRAEIGYALNQGYWGKGLMKEAAKEVFEFGFNRLKLHSVEANVNPANMASIRMLESMGFKREGHLKENYFTNGHFVDTVIFTLHEEVFNP